MSLTATPARGECLGKQVVIPSILNFPFEVMLQISEQLSVSNLMSLSLTCRRIRDVLFNFHEDSLASPTKKDKLEFQLILARDLPYEWLCQRCRCFHDVLFYDTPADHDHPSCPYRVALGAMSESHGYESFQVQHRHVYLAVLYNELQNKSKFQMDYLERLLEPYYFKEGYCRSRKNTNFGLLNGTVGYWATPKIVAGRYLLFSQWEYDRSQDRRPRYHYFGKICDHRPRPSASDTSSVGVCAFCPTEFSITVTGERMMLSTWKDLGTGKSPMDNIWRWDTVPGAVCRAPDHTFGSIRARFEGA